MRSYDCAETFELVSLYLHNQLQQYISAIRKKITAIFKEEGLKITIEIPIHPSEHHTPSSGRTYNKGKNVQLQEAENVPTERTMLESRSDI